MQHEFNSLEMKLKEVKAKRERIEKKSNLKKEIRTEQDKILKMRFGGVSKALVNMGKGFIKIAKQTNINNTSRNIPNINKELGLKNKNRNPPRFL